MHKVLLERSAEKDLGRLSSDIHERVIEAIQSLASDPRPPGCQKVAPSVVLLVREDSNGQPLAMGSGFVIKDCIVATNLHVIEGASRGYAKLADQKDKFNISGTVATDAARDIVLLAVENLKAPLLTLGDSKLVAVGDEVYAVGNPRGLEGTFSAGIISSIRKVGDDSLLQITAPISPGSSGGPVVNSKAPLRWKIDFAGTSESKNSIHDECFANVEVDLDYFHLGDRRRRSRSFPRC